MGTALFDFVIPFVVVLGVLVFIHELGHFLAAKIFGMKVDAFSLGFPPRAWGFRWATRRLQLKFKKDIATVLENSATFRRLHDILASRGLSRTLEDTAALILRWYDIRREEVVEESVNKKGKKEKTTRTLTRVTYTSPDPPPLEDELRETVTRMVTDDPELVEQLWEYRQIHDEAEFNAHWRTDYCLSWVPLGGYCKINGMVDESFDPESMKEGVARPWEYRAKPIWQRMVAITGGVLFNFLLAALIFASLAWLNGLPDLDQYNEYKMGTQISSVIAGSPAEGAGLQSGDVITAVDGTPVDDWQKLVAMIHAKPGQPILVEWTRGTQTMQAEMVPKRGRIGTGDEEKEVGQIGIVAPQIPAFTREASLSEAVAHGFSYTAGMTIYIVRSVKQIVFGEQSFKEAMGGPVAIFRMTGEVKQQRGWEGIWSFMALLSISLAVFNLFPIPALDGGHLVFLLIEAVMRRPVSIKVKLYAQQIGMAVLLTFIAYVIYNDLAKWHSGM